MTLAPLLDALTADPGVARALAAARAGEPAVDISAPTGARAALVASLARQAGRPLLAVTATTREAEDLVSALGCFLDPDRVADFPAWETLPHERLSPRSDTVGKRLAVLRRLSHPDESDSAYGPLDVVVAPVRAVLQPVVEGLGELRPVALRAGDEAPMERVVEELAAAAYARTDLVERRGEFAVRGGILDVFPPTEDHPVRVEFWGDTVEEIRWFKVADQRSLEIAGHGLWAPPCREILLTDQVRERARVLADQLPGVADILGKLAEGIAVEGMESLAPALVEGMESLLDVLRPGTHVVLCDPERIRTRAHDLVATSAEFLDASWSNAAAGNVVPVDLQGILGSASYWGLAEVRGHALQTGRPWWSLTSFAGDDELAAFTDGDDDLGERFTIDTADVEPYRGDTPSAVADIGRWVRDGWQTLVVTDGHGLAKRVVEVLGEHDVPGRLEDGPQLGLEPGVAHVTTGSMGKGFVAAQARLVVVTETDLTGSAGQGPSTKDMRRM